MIVAGAALPLREAVDEIAIGVVGGVDLITRQTGDERRHGLPHERHDVVFGGGCR
ncbi:MAG TPA: hypothetical protein VK047_03130 [Zeimonas sp.]|nr:hypothetical protein [Zeimonas sp.]